MIAIPSTPAEFSNLKKLCVEKIYLLFDKANREFGIKLSNPKITFDLHGKVGGKAMYEKNWIRLNEHFLFHNPDDFFITVTTHESCHLFTHAKWPSASAHGSQWASTMRFFGILNPKTCHNYDISVLPKYAGLAQKRKQMIKNAFSSNPIKTFNGGRIIEFD